MKTRMLIIQAIFNRLLIKIKQKKAHRSALFLTALHGLPENKSAKRKGVIVLEA